MYHFSCSDTVILTQKWLHKEVLTVQQVRPEGVRIGLLERCWKNQEGSSCELLEETSDVDCVITEPV